MSENQGGSNPNQFEVSRVVRRGQIESRLVLEMLSDKIAAYQLYYETWVVAGTIRMINCGKQAQLVWFLSQEVAAELTEGDQERWQVAKSVNARASERY